MARALADIITELNSVYNPQRDVYSKQVDTLDPQMAAEQQGLQAQQQDSFKQITDTANRRGLLFSGIPLQEQAAYTGQSFLPAVANLKSKYAQQRFNLQDAIAKITQDQYLKGQDIYQGEVTRDEEARQFNERLAAQARADEANRAAARAASGGAGSASPSFGGGGGGGGGTAPQAQQSLQSFLANQYKSNPNANRATQDAWVRYYAQQTGGNANDPNLWAAYNNLYPWGQYSDQARQAAAQQPAAPKPAAAVPGAQAIPAFNSGGAFKSANPLGIRF